jgi:hypothetical protein
LTLYKSTEDKKFPKANASLRRRVAKKYQKQQRKMASKALQCAGFKYFLFDQNSLNHSQCFASSSLSQERILSARAEATLRFRTFNTTAARR